MVYAEQQIAKKREKRDYAPPTDSMWPKQWYLVSLALILHFFPLSLKQKEVGTPDAFFISINIIMRNIF